MTLIYSLVTTRVGIVWKIFIWSVKCLILSVFIVNFGLIFTFVWSYIYIFYHFRSTWSPSVKPLYEGGDVNSAAEPILSRRFREIFQNMRKIPRIFFKIIWKLTPCCWNKRLTACLITLKTFFCFVSDESLRIMDKISVNKTIVRNAFGVKSGNF